MDDLTAKAGIGGLSGTLGILAGWLGLRAKIRCLESRVDKMSEGVRYIDTCEVIADAIKAQLVDIKSVNKEISRDVKKLLERGCGGK